MKRRMIAALLLIGLYAGIAYAVSLCAITGSVLNSDGSACASCTIVFSPNGNLPQIVNGVAVSPKVVYSTTDASGNMTSVNLYQGTAMMVTIQNPNRGISAPIQVAVPFNSGVTFAQLLAQNQLVSGVTFLNTGTKAITSTSSPYSIVAADFFISCDASGGVVTINLPASSGGGRWLHVKKTDSSANACTIARAGGDTIDGVATYALSFQYAGIFLNDTVSGAWSTQGPIRQTHLALDMGSNKITGLGAGTTSGDSFAYSLNTINQTATPTADFAMGSHKLTGLTAGVSSGDSFALSLNSINQTLAPTADFSMNSHKVTSLAAPAATGNALSEGNAIGAVTPSTGAFTTLSATTPLGITSGGTGMATGSTSLCFGSSRAVAASSTNWLACGENQGPLVLTAQSLAQALIPATCTASHLQIKIITAPNANVPVFTVEKNGSSTALTCTVAASATTCSDTSHSFTTAAGDLLDIAVVNPASANSTGAIYFGYWLNC